MTILASDRNKLKSFKDLDFLNESIHHHMETLKENTDQVKIMELLQRMAEHSVKTLGVSFLSNKTMAHLIGVSIRTVQRYTATMERLGVLSKIRTHRNKNRGQTSNTYVIHPVLKWRCHGGCRPLNPSLKPSLKQDDINNIISSEKLLKLFNWKLKDKTVQHGSSYVQKVVDTLFEYASNLIDQEDRRKEFERILQEHGCTNDYTHTPPSLDWFKRDQLEFAESKPIPKYLGWLAKP